MTDLDILQPTPALERFDSIRSTTQCFFARLTRLVGAPAWQDAPLEENVAASIPRLLWVTQHGRAHRIDGLVFEARGAEYGRDLPALCRTLRRVLRVLSDADPARVRCMSRDLEQPDWQFSFRAQYFFIITFAPCYAPAHPRHAPLPDATFVFFQPDHSFDFHMPEPAGHPAVLARKAAIRQAFARAGRPYDASISTGTYQAHKYVKPLVQGEPPVAWWREEPAP